MPQGVEKVQHKVLTILSGGEWQTLATLATLTGLDQRRIGAAIWQLKERGLLDEGETWARSGGQKIRVGRWRLAKGE